MIVYRKGLPWVVYVVIIFSLIYGSSYAALLWRPAAPKVDTRSVLTAGYIPWSFLVFQPLDPAIIKEIRQEQELPDQLVIPGSFWPASTAGQPSTDLNSITGETPNTQPSWFILPGEVTQTPLVSATLAPDSTPDPTGTPTKNPRKNTPKPKNTRYPHPDK